MNETQQAVRNALLALDPVLAGVFARACALADTIETSLSGLEGSGTGPAVDLPPRIAAASVPNGDIEPTRTTDADTILLAHLGREIANRVLRIVSAEAQATFDAPIDRDRSSRMDRARVLLAELFELATTDDRIGRALDQLGDRLGDRVARLLEVDAGHGVVRNWVAVVRGLVARAHLPDRPGGVPSEPVLTSFDRLTQLLWARLAPYFDAEDRISRLLDRPPTDDDREALLSLFLRPRLRIRFFSACADPEWLEFLDRERFFAYAPDFDSAGDNTTAPMSWPEGAALVNTAAAAPDLVTRIIKARVRIDANRNPLVWDQVSRAVELLPATQAGTLVPELVHALHLPHTRYAQVAVLKAAGVLARAGDPGALELAKAMLKLSPVPPVDPDSHQRMSPPTYNLLENCDDYYIERLMADVVPLIADQDAVGTITLLVERLDLAVAMLEQAGYDDGDYSHHWLSHWSPSRPGRDDLRADLARAIDLAAQQALTNAPTVFSSIAPLVRNRPSHVMKRLWLRFVIAAGPHHAADEIDQVISSEWILDPEFGAREVAELLRRHYTTAGTTARSAIVRRLEAGPSEGRIRAHLEWMGDDPADLNARTDYAARWQASRLRWFHGTLPEDLKPIAELIGFVPDDVDQERQDLDEVGHWSSGAVWAGDGSPRSVDDLRRMSSADIADFLLSWTPTEAEQFNDINRRGLADRLRQLLAEDVGSHRELLSHLASREGIDPAYLSAALTACSAIAKDAAGDAFPWQEVLALAQAVIAAQPSGAPEDRARLWARREALRFLVDSNKSSTFPPDRAGELVCLVDHAVITVPAWAHLEEAEFASFESIGMAALNHDAGLVVDLIVAVTRFLAGTEGHDITDADERVASWLNSVLEWNGTIGAAARWQLGHHLPALLYYADTWVQANEQDLFGRGMSDPMRAPTWGAYLLSYGVYDNVFRRLEPWYRHHAGNIEQLQAWEASFPDARDDQRLSRHFVEHAGMGLLRGLIHLEDARDLGLRNVLTRGTDSDRAHFAWWIMRALDDAEKPLQEGFTERVVQYWSWRLEEAAHNPVSAKELDSLGWLVRIEQLQPEITIDLAVRTMEADPTKFDVRGHVWKSLLPFIAIDPIKAVRMVEAMVSGILGGEYPYVHFEEVGPVLSAILESGNVDAKTRAVSVVNRLGEAGWSEFRTLLT